MIVMIVRLTYRSLEKFLPRDREYFGAEAKGIANYIIKDR
jgi:hypothetical protein